MHDPDTKLLVITSVIRMSFMNNQTLLCVQIGDLGLSKVKQRTLVSGGVRGTIPWMAPELINGKSNMVTDKVLNFFL